MNYAAFDLEIAKEIPDGTDDWHDLVPLGISCAAVSVSGKSIRTFFGRPPQCKCPPQCGCGHHDYNSQMSQDECKELVYYLASLHVQKYPVVSWNGLGFDFDVLHDESQCSSIIARLVPDHVDIGFAMFADKGFMCGLNAAAIGMSVGEKTEGVSGKDAPAMWKESKEKQDIILTYVNQDALITGLVYEAVTTLGYLQWTAKSGRVNRWRIPKSGIPTVREAMGKPLPNTSWMDNPWPREKFSGWLLRLLEEQGML